MNNKRHKLSMSEVKEILLENKLYWIDGVSEYIRQNTPIICCDENGYTVKARISDITRGLAPRPFDIRNEYTIENINIFVKNKNPNVSLISDKYIGTDELLQLKCDIDGNVINTSWHNIQKNNLICNKCLENDKILKNTVSLEYLKHKISKTHIIVYANDNLHMEDFVDCYCEKHSYNFKMKCKTLLDGMGCPKCRNNTLELEDVIERIRAYNPNIEILNTSYLNAKSRLECRCSIDGHVWSAFASSLLQGYGCPECARLNSEGYYCVYRAEKMKDKWIKQECSVYLLKLYDEIETFYKIGITKNSVEKRFSSKIALPYSYEIIDIINMNLYDAIYFETNIKKTNIKNKYIPIKNFHGRSECFINNPYDTI